MKNRILLGVLCLVMSAQLNAECSCCKKKNLQMEQNSQQMESDQGLPPEDAFGKNNEESEKKNS